MAALSGAGGALAMGLETRALVTEACCQANWRQSWRLAQEAPQWNTHSPQWGLVPHSHRGWMVGECGRKESLQTKYKYCGCALRWLWCCNSCGGVWLGLVTFHIIKSSIHAELGNHITPAERSISWHFEIRVMVLPSSCCGGCGVVDVVVVNWVLTRILILYTCDLDLASHQSVLWSSGWLGRMLKSRPGWPIFCSRIQCTKHYPKEAFVSKQKGSGCLL